MNKRRSKPVDGLNFAIDELIAANARVIDSEDPFASPILLLLALDAKRAGFQVVQWPDGLIGVARSGLTGQKRIRALVAAYKIAHDDLLAPESDLELHDA